MLKLNQNYHRFVIMRYFFVLGSNPTLSMAELAAVFKPGRFYLLQKNIAILESRQEVKSDILKKIGGAVKFGLTDNEPASFFNKDILRSISSAIPEKYQGKFNFGLSYYGKSKINLKILAMEFKKILKQSGISSRWVVSREPTLSSVVAEQNKLTTDRGVEIVIIEFNKKLLLGKTLAVQPFKELSFRDYGRPARDDRSGMLPPKLAQIMINLAGLGSDSTILDPFCGSGTILTEAMLMGYRNLIGLDISNKAIKDTKTNIVWTQSEFKILNFKFKIFNADASQLSKHIAPNSIDAIVTEPYLGPQRGKPDINKTINELEKLYSDSLREFYKILKPSGRVVMVWPVFNLSLRASGGSEAILRASYLGKTLNPNLNGFTIVSPIPQPLRNNAFLKLTPRNTIVYGREGQKVWREIVVLEKKN